jgi:exonuclease III
MKIVSWNCQNGLGNIKAKIILDEFPYADIFIIQECKRKDIYAFECNWKFKDWYGDDQEYSDLGIAVFSKNHVLKFTTTFNRNFRYVVPYTLKIDKKSLTLFAVWTKPVPIYYDKNVTEAAFLPEYKDIINNNAIIIGDFNTGYSDEHPERYLDLCNNLNGFINCAQKKPEEYKKTYYSNSKNKLYVNDFCFVSENLFSNIKEIQILNDWDENDYGQKSWRGLSDHCPIIVDFEF